MRLQKGFTLMLLISLLSIAATTDKGVPATTVATQSAIVYPTAIEVVQPVKMNFLQRLMYKMAMRKFRKAAENEKADKQAKSALVFGLSAMGVLLLGLFVPYIVLGTLPLGIIAMVMGKQALIHGTSEPAKAKIGRTMGLLSMIALAALFLIAIIIVATWDWNP